CTNATEGEATKGRATAAAITAIGIGVVTAIAAAAAGLDTFRGACMATMGCRRQVERTVVADIGTFEMVIVLDIGDLAYGGANVVALAIQRIIHDVVDTDIEHSVDGAVPHVDIGEVIVFRQVVFKTDAHRHVDRSRADVLIVVFTGIEIGVQVAIAVQIAVAVQVAVPVAVSIGVPGFATLMLALSLALTLTLALALLFLLLLLLPFLLLLFLAVVIEQIKKGWLCHNCILTSLSATARPPFISLGSSPAVLKSHVLAEARRCASTQPIACTSLCDIL